MVNYSLLQHIVELGLGCPNTDDGNEWIRYSNYMARHQSMYSICYEWVLITTRYCRRSLHLASSFDFRKSGSRVLIYEGQKQIENASFTWNTMMDSRDIQIVDTWDSSMLTTAIPRMRLIQFCVNKMNLPSFFFKTVQFDFA